MSISQTYQWQTYQKHSSVPHKKKMENKNKNFFDVN